ncbi:uncharacterized protein EKO05_0009064 [Ascochyta rabiei]|nr:uncharacterized protein EKO05_0009064 [Ascochyta rabiei]UPX18773.1 hypothetical protein EKO05_0009064 [Ascochyta rabiei]
MAYFGRTKYFPWHTFRSGYTSVSTDTQDSRSSYDKESENGLLQRTRRYEPAPTPVWRQKRLIAGHVVLFMLYFTGIFVVLKNQTRSVNTAIAFSPAADAIQYEDTIFKMEGFIQEGGEYAGRPTPKLDQAWHDLLNAENIKIDTKYMKHYARENIGVAVPEGGGFIGTLNVYHELHCLKRIHQFMYPEYYFKDFSPRQHELNRMHNEHCIDFLRMSAMCHGDIGLITYEWHDNSLIPVANATSHQCVNWDKLDRWTKENTVDMMKPGWLVHPTKGVAYPQGTGDKLGAVDSTPHLQHGGHGH